MEVQGLPGSIEEVTSLISVNETIPDHSEEETKELQWPSPGAGGGSGMLSGSGIKSPGGTTCGRPKTIKEYEDELIELRRDNFDLRMRIYLMEEHEENAVNTTSVEQAISSRVPPTFAQLKELYINNSQLKEEITALKRQLVEKEELAVKATNAIEILEKNQLEMMERIKSEANQEIQKLQSNIAQLNQELMEVKVSHGPNLKDQKSALFDDSNAMYAMAFGLPIPGNVVDPEKLVANEKINALELQLTMLERDMKEEMVRRLSCDDKLDRIQSELKASEDSRRLLSDELKHREAELRKAHKLIEEKCQTMAELQDKINRFNMTTPLVDNSTAEKKAVECDGSKRSNTSSVTEFEEKVTRLTEQLKSQKLETIRIQGENMKAMRTIQGLVKQNKALTRDLEHYKCEGQTTSKVKASEEIIGDSSTLNKDNRITELEAEVTVLKGKLSAVSFGGAQDTTTLSDLSLLKSELELKNNEIDNLNEELKKRTFNLQELVNKELWDKNREIEKLNLTCERKQTEFNNLKQELNVKNVELVKLQEELKKKISGPELTNIDDLPLKNFEFKENKNPNLPLSVIIDEKLKNELKLSLEDNCKLKEEVESLNKKLTDQISICIKLKDDRNKWQNVAEESEKSKKELINACTLLTTRLEELSTFLESLLPSLGSKKRKMLQQAIDRSREMSRSFSFMDQSNFSISIPLLPDVSQVDFYSGDETINNIGDKVISSENDEVTRLRNQVESLVERLKKKEGSPVNKSTKMTGVWNLDDERLEDISEGSLLDSLSEISETNLTNSGRKRASLAIIARPAEPITNVSPQQHCLSESDGGWSEPDRNVSKERIGISEVSPAPKPPINSSEDSMKSSKKSPSGKKGRNEGLLELKRLSAKLDYLEQMNESLHAELQVIHRANAVRLEENNVIISKPNSPKSLRDIVNKRRRSLERAINLDNQNAFEKNTRENPEVHALTERMKEISVQLESSCRHCLELEERCFTLESERQELELRLNQTEDKLKLVQSELEQTSALLKEKDNFLLERQCALLEANNNNILLNAKLETITENLNIKQEQLEKYEREISEKDEKSKELFHEMEELKKQSELFESELKSRLEISQREVEEAVTRRLETERRLIESYEHQTELRSRLDQEILRNKDLDNHLKHEERSWRRRLSECETLRAEREAELRRKLDTAVLTTSEAVLERTRLANDKLKLQQDIRAKETTHFSVMKELERRVGELETLNSELEAAARCRWEVRQEPLGARSPTGPRSPTFVCSPPSLHSPRMARSPTTVGALSPPMSPSSPRSPRPPQRLLSNPSSDYVSDQEHPYQVNGNFWMMPSGRCNNNCSPDLGIESDHHSLATCGKVPSLDPLPAPSANGDVAKLEAENDHLRKHLLKTRKALADTLSQLTSANQKKRQVERAICKQIHKTHHVLQKARVNFESNENLAPSQ